MCCSSLHHLPSISKCPGVYLVAGFDGRVEAPFGFLPWFDRFSWLYGQQIDIGQVIDDPLDEDMPGDSAPSRDDHVKAKSVRCESGSHKTHETSLSNAGSDVQA